MTWIRIEPAEMNSTAGMLRASATELSGIGSAVHGDTACCCAPTAVEAQVTAAATALLARMAAVAEELVGQAADLQARGQLAAQDSLSLASGAAGTASPTTGSSTVVGGSTPAYSIPGSATIFGASVIGGTSVYDHISAPSWTPGPMVIGGGSAYDGVTVLPPGSNAVSSSGSMVIGGPSAERDRIASLPPALFNVVTGSQARAIDVILEPSRTEVGRGLGYPITATQYTGMGYRGLNS